jgi:hypothetical protein
MSVPPWAGLVANFPDDQVATADEILVYGGRNVAIALGELLAGLGCTNVAAPWDVSDVGWEFDFNYKGRHSFLCRVQSFHPIFWLLFEDHSSRGDRRRSPDAHFELWQKFTSALEQDPRFDQILWRTSKEGPPDWDEFTVPDHLRERSVVEELPPRPTKPRPKAAGGPLAPAIIGGWFALLVVTLIAVENTIHGAKAQADVTSLAIAGLLVALAAVLVMIDRRRKRRLQSSSEEPDSEA